MKPIIGKKLNNVEFVARDNKVYGKLQNNGVAVEYEIKPVEFVTPCEAILMDLDGTTLTSEEFWMFIIEQTVKTLMNKPTFALENADIPFVSGFTTADHLTYCINKYCTDKSLNDAIQLYHGITEKELDKIMRGEGHVSAFTPTEGLKDFLLEVKARKIKVGLATSGLDYKAIPEIVAVFQKLNMGNPLDYYDAIITGGKRKDVRQYGTLGEIVSKPHPWIYTELAHMGLHVQNPQNVIGIEDSAAGVMSLRFAGFPAIGLNSGNIGDSGLDTLCHAKVDTLQQILKIIK